MIKYSLSCLLFLFLNQGVLCAITLEQASNKIAEYFSKTDVQHKNNKKIFIQVVNAYTKENDVTSKKIETGLKHAFSNQFNEMEVSFGFGKNETIQISANYRQRGIATLLQVTAYNTSTKNIILGSKIITFIIGEEREKKLAAILDITSAELTPDQKEDFGGDFRSELSSKDLFEDIEIVDIDDFDIDAIRKGSNCVEHVILDKCAREIGIQLKADWVVSSSYIKASDDTYILSGKILDIVNRTTLATDSVEHNGNLDTLEEHIDMLAKNLASSAQIKPEPQRTKQPYIPLMVTGRSRMPSRAELLAEGALLDTAPRAPVNWHIFALTTIGVTSTLSFIFAMNYNDNVREARDAIERGDYEGYEKSARKAKDMEHAFEVTDGMTVAAILWEAYLIFISDINFDGTLASAKVKTDIKPTKNGYTQTSFSFQWNW